MEDVDFAYYTRLSKLGSVVTHIGKVQCLALGIYKNKLFLHIV